MAQRIETPDIMGAVLAGNDQPLATTLRIADIRRDGGTQPRAGLDELHVNDLVAALAAGETLPPVDVMYDGATYWLYDGYHRVEATSRAGKYTVLAVIHQGDQVAAQWASYAANSRHGLKRTNEDKRRAVLAALRHPNAAEMSNRALAAHVGVDESMVRDHRAKLEATAGIPQSTTRTGADGRTINTANIGTNQPAYAPVWKLESEVRDVCAAFYDADDQRHTLSDMRAAAKLAVGGFWNRCTNTIAATPDITAWRVSDLRQAINNVAAQMEAAANGTNYPAGDPHSHLRQATPVATGRPMMAVFKTDAEADDALRADIASREAAADEAERQAGIASRTDAEREAADAADWEQGYQARLERWRVADARRKAAAAEPAGTNSTTIEVVSTADIRRQAAPLADLPVVATTATDTSTRYQVAASNLRSAMQALSAAADAIRGLDDYVLNSIDSATSRLRQVAATCVERGEPQSEQPPAAAPAPEPPPAPTELPAELVAAGWTLTTMRGKHYASVMVPSEPEPIRTIGRGDVVATIRDAEYMHRNLRIGGGA